MNIIKIISEELKKFFKENYDSEQGSILGTYFDKKHFTKKIEKPEETLSGEFVGDVFPESHYRENLVLIKSNVYKNPQTLVGFDPDCRGILVENGDLYVVDNSEVYHVQIIRFLERNNIISKGLELTYYRYYPEDIICLQRHGSTNVFQLSVLYDKIPKYYINTINNYNSKSRIKIETQSHKWG